MPGALCVRATLRELIGFCLKILDVHCLAVEYSTGDHPGPIDTQFLTCRRRSSI